MYTISADEVRIGQGVKIEPGVELVGSTRKKARRIIIGDQVKIGANTRAFVDDLVIGDYTTIHNSTFISGRGACSIGHFCWIGQSCILDCQMGLTIGNGVGVGAGSQLWSHIHHGDVLNGCRFDGGRELVVEDDVWFLPRVVVSPITARAKSMALAGSVVTRDMEANRVYGGVPATDITDKVGPQFAPVSAEEKLAKMRRYLREFFDRNPHFDSASLVVVDNPEDASRERRTGATVFDVSDRTYNRSRTEAEFAFVWFLMPNGKFFPCD